MAQFIGIDMQNKKVTNHTHRSTAVPQLACAKFRATPYDND